MFNLMFKTLSSLTSVSTNSNYFIPSFFFKTKSSPVEEEEGGEEGKSSANTMITNFILTSKTTNDLERYKSTCANFRVFLQEQYFLLTDRSSGITLLTVT